MPLLNKDTIKKETIDELIDFLKNGNIKVSVFGEFNMGKSTFLNAIINEEILSEDWLPTTAVPTKIIFSNLFNISVQLRTGENILLYQNDNEEKKWRKYIGSSNDSILNI